MTNKKDFGIYIKSKREEHGYSQKQLADILYVTESAISKWERGLSYPDISLITSICKTLDISEHEFITASTDNSVRKINKEAKLFRRINNLWFFIPCVSYAITILVCFICNLAIEHKLSWFFVVFTSLLTGFSFIPTFTSFAKKYKLLVFILSTYLSIALLLITCGVFVHNFSFVPISLISILIGYVLLFMPLGIKTYKLNDLINKCRFLINFILTVILTIVLMMVIHVNREFDLLKAILLVLFFGVFVIGSSLICLLNINLLMKSGIVTLITGAVVYSSGFIINAFYPESYKTNNYQVNFLDWTNYCNGNVQLIIILTTIVIGVSLLAIGIRKKIKA